jgi:hypothetical protein
MPRENLDLRRKTDVDRLSREGTKRALALALARALDWVGPLERPEEREQIRLL